MHTERSVRRRIVASVSLALAAILTLTSCTLLPSLLAFLPSPDAGTTTADGFATAREYYEQDITWRSCAQGMECATVIAPQDWEAVSAKDPVSLKLTRHQATGSDRLGSVFVNPGGPGGSGISFVQDSLDSAASKRLQEYYDVIGWDPRGVGESAGVVCYEPAQMDEYLFGIPTSTPRTEAWMDELRADARQFGEACAEQTGSLLGHVDTINTAHDLDLMRAVVNDAKLNYIGYSYGTLIGSTYAELFPKKVGRMVLDGVVAPNASVFDMVLFQTKGFEAALGAYLNWCKRNSDCPFPGTVEQAKASVSSLLAKVEATPLQGSDGRMLGVSTLLTAIIFPLYSEDYWPYLNDLFSELKSGETEMAFTLADAYLSRDTSGAYLDNSNEAFAAINCLGYERITDYDTIKKNAEAIAAAAPIFGKYQGYGELACIDWPEEPVLFEQDITAAGAPPILVIGTTGDPATPYQWAVDLAGTLKSGVLVTYNGEGHTAYNRSNDCILDAVDDYMIDGTVPSADPQC